MTRKIILLAALSAALCGCLKDNEPANKQNNEPVSKQNFQLDTLVTITIYDGGSEDIFKEAFDEIGRLESILSATLTGSDLYALEKNAGKEFIKVSEETIFLINECRKFSEISDGAFDCTVGPLVSIWGIKDHKGRFPLENELAEALSLINYNDILIKDGNYVMLKRAGMKLDFGGIAKGYIADRVKELLIGKGIRSAAIDLGGNIVLIGAKPGGADFKIGIQHPEGARGDYIGIMEISGKSLVTSGSYERFFIHEGKAYHHILDVNIGFPVENELLEVTVISDISSDGDGFSTSAFCLGLQKGLNLLNSSEGIEGIFVTKDRKIYLTEGIGEEFIITDADYTLVREGF